jgi:vitamin B12 transporter
MTSKKLFLFWILLLCQVIVAQHDAIVRLREVVVADVQLRRFSNSLSVQKLNDSIIEKNQSSLTSLLQYNTVIYFKQNGLGMVSSPSFRGTTAQQTAVIWNGININSQLTGQTDFNTITTNDFESITVRAGGGSAIYGSSAIGGSIHLNNELRFDNQFRSALSVNYGSFNTFGANFKSSISNEKLSSNISVSRNSSDNDYEYLGTNGKKNNNGQFYNTSMNVSVGYQFNAVHSIKIYSQLFESERHFSGTIASPSRSKYQDLNTRNLLEWNALYHQITSSLKVAFLSEKYKYFENFVNNNYETSKVATAIVKYDLGYAITPKFDVNAIVDYTQAKGIGSNIGDVTRNVGSASILMRYQFLKQLHSEVSVRKETNTAYESPWLFAVGIEAPLTTHYLLKLNGSRNFRAPTFNDLYWKIGGNPNLKPEQSDQAELGQELHFKNFKLTATVYYNSIKDMLRWTPKSGIWSPENIDKVTSYGAEILLNANKKIGRHLFDLNATYAYTVSKNDASGYQLTFVPYHKLTADLAYSFRKMTFNYQYLFNGYVYTLSDESTILKEYSVSNMGINYTFGKTNTYSIGFQTLNIWNENYQSVPSRPLPGRNYQININFKF